MTSAGPTMMSPNDLEAALQQVRPAAVLEHLARLGCVVECPDQHGWQELAGGREFADCVPATVEIDGVASLLMVQATRTAGVPDSARVDHLEVVPARPEERWAERMDAALTARYGPGDVPASDVVFSHRARVQFTLLEDRLLVARRGAMRPRR